MVPSEADYNVAAGVSYGHDFMVEPIAKALATARRDAVRELLGDVTTEDLTWYFFGLALVRPGDWGRRLTGLKDRLLFACRELEETGCAAPDTPEG